MKQVKGNSYSDNKFWDDYWKKENRESYEFIFSDLLNQYIDWGQCNTYMEIGGAPGNIMMYMMKSHDLEVSTVDFCDLNILLECLPVEDMDKIHIYNEDFLKFNIEKYRKSFNIVASFGFIEHFSLDISKLFIRKQMEMVAKDGYLIVELPNIRFFNWLLYKVINPKLLDIHNLATMDLEFIKESILEDTEFDIVYGDYWGTSFLNYSSSNEFFKKHTIIKKCVCYLKAFLEFFHMNNIPNRFFSPYIIFIAKRIK